MKRTDIQIDSAVKLDSTPEGILIQCHLTGQHFKDIHLKSAKAQDVFTILINAIAALAGTFGGTLPNNQAVKLYEECVNVLLTMRKDKEPPRGMN